MAPEDKSMPMQPDAANLAVAGNTDKPAEAMQVDYQASSSSAHPAGPAGAAAAGGAEQITGVVPVQNQAMPHAKKIVAIQGGQMAPAQKQPQANEVVTSQQQAPNLGMNAGDHPAQQQVQFLVTSTEDNNGKDRRSSSGAQNLKKMELTAQNIEAHQQQLIQQDSNVNNGGGRGTAQPAPGAAVGSAPAQPSNQQAMANNPAQAAATHANACSTKATKDASVVAAQQQQQLQTPAITLQARSATPATNPGPGRPSGSTNANRKQKQAAAAAAAAAAEAQQQQAQQQQAQQQQQQPAPANFDPQQLQAEAYARQQQQQKMMSSQQQQQRGGGGSQRMTQEQYMNYQREQQQMLQQQKQQQQQQQQQAHNVVPSGSAAALTQQQQQLAMQQAQQLHRQQSFTSQSHHHQAATHQSQAAVAYQQAAAQQHTHANQNYKVLTATIYQRINQQLRDNSGLLQSADKQHAESLAKQIKKEELNFFLKTDDTRHNKQSLLEQKNQRMDEYIAFCAENGGRVIPKQPEPLEAPRETPLIVEARIMHMDFVEEAYWKRVQASRIAQECRIVALRKAQQREQRRREEARLQAIEEQRKKEEELQKQQTEAASAAAATQQQMQQSATAGLPGVDPAGALNGQLVNNAQGQDAVMPGASSMMIDTTHKAMVDNQGQEMLDFMGGDNNFPALDGGFDSVLDGVGYDDGMDGLNNDGDDMGVINDDYQDDFGDFGGLDDMDQYGHNNDVVNNDPNQMEDDDLNQEDEFDPEAMIIQQEQRLEQQRMQEESKKQEEEKLQKIAQIEQEANQAQADSHHSYTPVLKEERVQTNLFEDLEVDDEDDNEDQLAALEAEIMALDLTYLKPVQDLRERNLKDGIAPQAATEDAMDMKNELMQEETKKQKARSSKDYIQYAKSAIKQKFDRLGQLIVEKGYNATEAMNTEQFNEAMTSLVAANDQAKNRAEMDFDYDGIHDKLSNLLQGDHEIGLYVMPGVEDFEFDSENEAVDLDQHFDEDEVMDIDGFFTDNDLVQGLQQQANQTASKIRAPTVLGDEQKRMYRELKEINALAPERNDVAHMEHLCQLWTVKEQEEIQDKKYIKEYFETNLRYYIDKELDMEDRKQQQAIQDNIRQYRSNIEMRQHNLEKNKRQHLQPKELHRERFLLTGSDHPQPQQQSLAPQEFSFIKWYYGLFPDQWRLIADIINYHPLTRGPLHCKEWMAREYFARLDANHRDLLLQRQKIQMQPWRETKLPWLINGREGCLMNSMTYLNKSHLQSIHKVARMAQRPKTKKKQVFRFSLNAQGCLQLEKAAESAAIQENQVIDDKAAELAGVKRPRAEIVEMQDHEESDTLEEGYYPDSLNDGRHYSDIQIQERLLSQMLARRRKIEEDENLASEEGKTVKIDIYADSPFLKELMMDIVHKRKRTPTATAEEPQQSLMTVTVPASSATTAPEKRFIAFAYDPVNTVKDELDTNTPMWYALQNMNSCQMTIRVQHSTMFWLGYFIRRIMHEENLERNKSYNFDKLPLWESENEIKNYFINQAKTFHQEQKKIEAASKTGEVPALITDYSMQQHDREREEQAQLQKEISHFMRTTSQITSRIEVKEVNDLWEGKQPYYYDKEQKQEYIKQEKDCDSRISNVMYQKSKQLWDEIQFYWFQVNKNLHPRYRKEPMDQQQQTMNSGAAGGPNNAVVMSTSQGQQVQQRGPPVQGQQQMVSSGQYPGVVVNQGGSMSQQMPPNQQSMMNAAAASSQAQQYAAAAAAAQGRMPPTQATSGQATIVTGSQQQNGGGSASAAGAQQRRQQYQHPNGGQIPQSQGGGTSQYLMSQGPPMPSGSQGGGMPPQHQQQSQPASQADMIMMSQRAASQAAAANSLVAAQGSGIQQPSAAPMNNVPQSAQQPGGTQPKPQQR